MLASTSRGFSSARVAHLDDVLVAEHGVVVEAHLGVERHDVAAAGHHQRIDLGERRVRVDIGLGEAGDQLRRLGGRRALQAQPRGNGPGLERQDSEMGIDGLAEDRLRVLGGDLLDVHAALAGGHDDRLALGAIEGDRDVQLLGDVGGLLDEHLAHELPFGAGLMGDELHAEDLAGQLASFLGRLGELDAAPLAAPAGVDLGLDDAPAAHLLADPGRLVGVVRHLAPGCRHPIPAQDLLGLIFMNLQDDVLRGSSLGT